MTVKVTKSPERIWAFSSRVMAMYDGFASEFPERRGEKSYALKGELRPAGLAAMA
jgi:hypothetical protein